MLLVTLFEASQTLSICSLSMMNPFHRSPPAPIAAGRIVSTECGSTMETRLALGCGFEGNPTQPSPCCQRCFVMEPISLKEPSTCSSRVRSGQRGNAGPSSIGFAWGGTTISPLAFSTGPKTSLTHSTSLCEQMRPMTNNLDASSYSTHTCSTRSATAFMVYTHLVMHQ